MKMKIYWKKLIWLHTIKYWRRLIHFRKSAFEKDCLGCYDWVWNSKQETKCMESLTSFLPKLDDVIRKVTAKDNAITTIVSTQADRKMYKNGKVIAMRKSFSNQTDKSSD